MEPKAEVPTCQREGCTEPLRGQQKKWCSETCKVDAWYTSKISGKSAEELLAALPQKELRAVIRRVCERRWPQGHPTNRLKVRFGRYNPRS